MKRLYYDIETTYCVGWFWNTGKQYIDASQILKPAEIICICYKWENEKTIHSLDWTDKDMLAKFAIVLDEADEVVAHNGKRFDQKWFAMECLKNRVPLFPTYKVVDTLSIMRAKFRSPSNRLNYLAQVLFGKEKTDTGGINLWHEVIGGNKTALKKMVSYCKNDVLLLEELYQLIESYAPPVTHVGVLNGNEKWTCARCGSENVKFSKRRVTAMGTERIQMQCSDCGRYYTVSNAEYKKFKECK